MGYNYLMIFDGKAFAEKIIAGLPHKKAKLAILLNPDDAGSVKYVEIKKRIGEKLGVEFEIYNLKFEINFQDLISKLNNDTEITGIMIQLPFPNSEKLINLIDPKKDVDGLREDSPFLPAAVLAVEKILTSPLIPLLNSGEGNKKGEVCVVGSKGFIGSKLVKLLTPKCQLLTPMDANDFDPEKIKLADIVISATGQEGLVKDIKEGAVCIDLGFPKGDFAPELASKASFFTPVPGGVGPVTVACLFENLYGTIPLLHTSPDSPYKHRRRED